MWAWLFHNFGWALGLRIVILWATEDSHTLLWGFASRERVIIQRAQFFHLVLQIFHSRFQTPYFSKKVSHELIDCNCKTHSDLFLSFVHGVGFMRKKETVIGFFRNWLVERRRRRKNSSQLIGSRNFFVFVKYIHFINHAIFKSLRIIALALWAYAFYKSIGPYMCLCVCLSVYLFSFEVQFKRLFAPSS